MAKLYRIHYEEHLSVIKAMKAKFKASYKNNFIINFFSFDLLRESVIFQFK